MATTALNSVWLQSVPFVIDMSGQQEQQQQPLQKVSMTGWTAAPPVNSSPPSSPFPSSSSSHTLTQDSDGIPSPSQSKDYPIPSSTAQVLRRRREEFFKTGPAEAGPSSSLSTSTPLVPQHRPMLTPGPLTNALSSSKVQRRSRPVRASPSLDPFSRGEAIGAEGIGSSASGTGGGSRATSRNDMEQNVSARLMRQRFRDRCQAVMARDRARAVARSRRGFDATVASNSQGDEGDPERCNEVDHGHNSSNSSSDGVLMSDDLSGSSEADGFDIREPWQEEDEEMVRRVMTAEYRSMLRAQEHSGRVEVGWLDPEEVAWLEEEMRREEEGQQRLMSDADEEPPADMIDEDEALSELYYAHRQQQEAEAEASAAEMRYTSDDDDSGIDDAWLANVDVDIEGGIWQKRLDKDDSMDMS